MKNHFEMIQFKPSEIALVILISARYLSSIKDNCKFNMQIAQDLSMDQDSLVYCKQAMDRLLLQEGLITETTRNSYILFNLNLESESLPLSREGSQDGESLSFRSKSENSI